MKLIQDLQNQINRKADWEQLDKALAERLAEIVAQLSKQFADKVDTRKALKLHEQQFKNLYNLIMSRGAGAPKDEDAMFTTKPLGGLSCASCEKGLTDMYGKKAEFMPWNKLPFRDPSDRIARVGQGFSKMLSMVGPDTISRYEMTQSRRAHQTMQSQSAMNQEDPPFY